MRNNDLFRPYLYEWAERMDSNSLLWITTIIMVAGGLAILLVGKRRTPSEEMQTVLHGIVPIIAACSYLAMATGQGLVLLPTSTAGVGRIFYFARYIDWFFTTPLLLLSLGLTAMHSGPRRTGAITGIVLADVMMIITSFVFSASEVTWMKWSWFIVSCIAFLGVYYVIWVSFLQANRLEREDIQSNYRRSAVILSVLWLIYPLVLAVAPDGLGILGDTASVLCIAILDVLAKVAYGLLATLSDAKTTDIDLAEETTRPTLRKAA